MFLAGFFLFAVKMGVSERQIARKAVLSYTVIGVYIYNVPQLQYPVIVGFS